MIIKNAKIFTQGGTFVDGGIAFGKTIEAVGRVTGDGLDAKGGYVIPGLIDVHTHGAMNCDFSDGVPDDYATMSRYYAAHGVTSFCATTMTLPEAELDAAMGCVRGFQRPADGAKCAGVYLEGPFLSMAKKGAQNGAYLHAPDADMFDRLNAASGGRVRLVGLAPEEDGAMEFIRRVSPVCAVSLAHTATDYDTACSAFVNGATQATHLFNGMNSFLHRAPGVVGAARDCGAYVELICDGLHIHPSVIRATFAMFPGKVVMISDSLRCAGMPDGKYMLGGQEIVMTDGRATLLDGTIAGSSISLLDGLRNVVNFGVPLAAAVEAASATPAKAIRMDSQIGSLVPGKAADMLVLDQQLDLVATIIDGEVVNG